MKKITKILLITLSLSFVSFSLPNKPRPTQLYYLYISAYEHDKQLEAASDWDSEGVAITTNIVSVDCDFLSKPGVEIQFDKYYEGEQANSNRNLYGYGFTNAWLYDTYDEAYASRRDWLAQTSSKNKRKIESFYVTCK